MSGRDATPIVFVTTAELQELIAEAVASALAGRVDASVAVEPAVVEPVEPAAPAPTVEPEYLTTREAAALLRTSTDTLERLRASGGGPPWCRVGRRILYSRSELQAFGRRG